MTSCAIMYSHMAAFGCRLVPHLLCDTSTRHLLILAPMLQPVPYRGLQHRIYCLWSFCTDDPGSTRPCIMGYPYCSISRHPYSEHSQQLTDKLFTVDPQRLITVRQIHTCDFAMRRVI